MLMPVSSGMSGRVLVSEPGVPMSLRPKSATLGLDQQWSQVQGMLRAEIGETTYRTWLGPLQLAGVEGDRVLLTVPTRFLRDWIAAHYADRIRALWHRLDPAIGGVALIVETTTAAAPSTPPPAAPASPAPALGTTTPPLEAPPAPEIEIGAPLDPRCTFEGFVVGPPNELAFAAARRVAELDAPPFNPLFLFGGVGLGKTHLMHAIAWQIRRQNPGRRVVYLSAEKFMYQFIKALRFKDTMSFKELFRSADVLMVDDVQFMGGKGSTQEEFFHTFNTLYEAGKQIVISSDRPPRQIATLEQRLRSRFEWGLMTDIQPPDLETRIAILQKKARTDGIQVADAELMTFIAGRVSTNIRELEGALTRVVAFSSLTGRPMTIDLAQDVLRDVFPQGEAAQVSIERIQDEVSDRFGLSKEELIGDKRSQNIVYPRQVAMYLSRELTDSSLPKIGRHFGGRDHTTVIHATSKIARLIREDRSVYNLVQELTARVKHAG
jgi:chromosomal replication initiator protein